MQTPNPELSNRYDSNKRTVQSNMRSFRKRTNVNKSLVRDF